jgi:NAD(P)-dependent dehydrogenase (short-subunit alcohol dehydrogenase family)
MRALVTGGSRGLGRAICLALARRGAQVAFTYSRRTQDADAARAAIAAVGAEPLVFQGSVADAAHVTATVDALLAAWGGIDVLVNNAGVHQVLPVALIEEPDWDAVMDVNVKGAFLFARAVLKPMIRARRGHILNIGSFASERIVESPVHYAAAKSALRGMTEALAREMGKYRIQVNLLAPGLLDVGVTRSLPRHRIDEYLQQCPAGRLGSAEELAEVAAWLVSEENSFMTGSKVVVDGGL